METCSQLWLPIADLWLFILSIYNVKQSYTSHWFRSKHPWKKDSLWNNMECYPTRRLTNSKKIQNEQNSMKQPTGPWNALIWVLKINLQHVWNSCCCLIRCAVYCLDSHNDYEPMEVFFFLDLYLLVPVWPAYLRTRETAFYHLIMGCCNVSSVLVRLWTESFSVSSPTEEDSSPESRLQTRSRWCQGLCVKGFCALMW